MLWLPLPSYPSSTFLSIWSPTHPKPPQYPPPTKKPAPLSGTSCRKPLPRVLGPACPSSSAAQQIGKPQSPPTSKPAPVSALRPNSAPSPSAPVSHPQPPSDPPPPTPDAPAQSSTHIFVPWPASCPSPNTQTQMPAPS